jgi:hypothetical protein
MSTAQRPAPQRRDRGDPQARPCRRVDHRVGCRIAGGVDRSYIYDQVDLLEDIRQRRATPVRPVARPAAERATLESLQARLASAHEEIARLKAENRSLRERVAIVLGDAWQAEIELPRAAGEV